MHNIFGKIGYGYGIGNSLLYGMYLAFKFGEVTVGVMKNIDIIPWESVVPETHLSGRIEIQY